MMDNKFMVWYLMKLVATIITLLVMVHYVMAILHHSGCPDRSLDDCYLFKGKVSNRIYFKYYLNSEDGIAQDHFIRFKAGFIVKSEHATRYDWICRIKIDNSIYGNEVFVDYRNGILKLNQQLYDKLPIRNFKTHVIS